MSGFLWRRMRNREHVVIGVVGPTGSGKTSLVCGWQRLYGWGVKEELPGDNPYLQPFYNQLNQGLRPVPSALASQLYFLRASVQQGWEIQDEEKPVTVWDVPPMGHRMYADLQYEAGILSPEDYRTYVKEYDRTVVPGIHPDLVVVTWISTELLQQRIRQRGREGEQRVDIAYWASQVAYWQAKLGEDGGRSLMEADSGSLNWLTDEGVVVVTAQMARRLPCLLNVRGVKCR